MPKMKTRRAAKKRFKISKTGKVLRRCAGMRHILSSKSTKRKRKLGKETQCAKSDVSRVRSMLPGSRV